MKKFIAPLLVGAALTSGFAADDLKKEIEALKAQMAELKNAQTKMNVDCLDFSKRLCHAFLLCLFA